MACELVSVAPLHLPYLHLHSVTVAFSFSCLHSSARVNENEEPHEQSLGVDERWRCVEGLPILLVWMRVGGVGRVYHSPLRFSLSLLPVLPAWIRVGAGRVCSSL